MPCGGFANQPGYLGAGVCAGLTARAHCRSGVHRDNKRMGHHQRRFGADEKRGSGKGIVSGFLARAEVKGAGRK